MTAGAIVWVKEVFPAVMLAGIYGLLCASFFVAMDAVDVAFTEAAVGAGVTPLLMLATLRLVGNGNANAGEKTLIAILVALVGSVLLIYATLDMPAFGDPSAPVHNHVAPRYIEDSYEEIGIPNIVTSVLASYRAFDTLGEVAVIFTAGIGVLALLAIVGSARGQASHGSGPGGIQKQMILRIVGKILIPPILIFALYVQFHGEYSPGGGFQAGVIFASAMILYTMLFGLNNARNVISETTLRVLAAVGLLLYGSVGILSLLAGGNFLDYNVLLENPVKGQHLGIIVIELGVGITVAAVMIMLFFSFVARIGAIGSEKE